MRPKLLYLSAFIPSPVPTQAGQKTAFRNLEWLAQEFDIHFLGFETGSERPGDVERLRTLCVEVRTFRLSWPKRIYGALLKPAVPLLVGARYSLPFARAVQAEVTANQFARVHCEWSQMLEYAELFAAVSERWVTVHDVVVQFCERTANRSKGIKRLLWQLEVWKAKRWEAKRLAAMTSALVLSQKDADLLRQLSPRVADLKIIVAAPSFDRLDPRERSTDGAEGPSILFWGAMARTENSEAALFLVEEVFPLVLKDYPAAKLIIAGSSPPDALKKYQSDAISVTGFVEDPQALFDRAHLAVLPLLRGAGIKVKVLECLAAGIPVVTTAIGGEGIPAGEEDGIIVTEESAEAMAGRVRDLLRPQGPLARLSAGAVAWGLRYSDAERSALNLGAPRR